jgi:hypothetical protein
MVQGVAEMSDPMADGRADVGCLPVALAPLYFSVIFVKCWCLSSCARTDCW